MLLRRQSLEALVLIKDFHPTFFCSINESLRPLESHFLMASENLATLIRLVLSRFYQITCPMPYQPHSSQRQLRPVR